MPNDNLNPIDLDAMPQAHAQEFLLDKIRAFAQENHLPMPDLSDPESIILLDRPTGVKEVNILVHLDLEDFAYHVLLRAPGEAPVMIRNECLFSADRMYNELTAKLSLHDLITPTPREWTIFEESCPGRRWIQRRYPEVLEKS